MDEPTRQETIDTLGKLVDQAENYLGFTELPTPPRVQIDALAHGLKDIRDEIKALYFHLGGTNHWGRY